jgi:hypothetical protein
MRDQLVEPRLGSLVSKLAAPARRSGALTARRARDEQTHDREMGPRRETAPLVPRRIRRRPRQADQAWPLPRCCLFLRPGRRSESRERCRPLGPAPTERTPDRCHRPHSGRAQQASAPDHPSFDPRAPRGHGEGRHPGDHARPDGARPRGRAAATTARACTRRGVLPRTRPGRTHAATRQAWLRSPDRGPRRARSRQRMDPLRPRRTHVDAVPSRRPAEPRGERRSGALGGRLPLARPEACRRDRRLERPPWARSIERDRVKDAQLVESGWRVVRITRARLAREPRDVAAQLARLLSGDG